MQAINIDGFRLSPVQRRLWQLHEGETRRCGAQCLLLVTGPLDRAALGDALNATVDRHEILRTRFLCLPEMAMPVQVIEPAANVPLEDLDLVACDGADQIERVQRLFNESGDLPFDDPHGPRIRARLIRLADTRHALLLGVPALCADAPTMRLWCREIARAYSGARLEDPPPQFADLSEWQNGLLEDEDAVGARDYWRRRQAAARPARVDPPSTGPRRSRRTTLDAERLARVSVLTGRYGVSPAAFFLACWKVLLFKTHGDADVVVGVGCDGRPYDQLREALGPLARVIAVGSRIDGATRFEDLAKQIAEDLTEIAEWQLYEPDSAGPDAGAAPRVPIGFEFTDGWCGEAAGEVAFSLSHVGARTEPFLLALSCVQLDRALTLELHYDAARFASTDIDRWMARYLAVLDDVLARPQATIGDLHILGAGERRLYEAVNSTDRAFASQTVVDMFEAQAAATPAAIAIEWEDEAVTYRRLNQRANQIARHLVRQGVGAETLVGLWMERGVELVAGMLGVLKAGGGYVPLDRGYPAERLAYMAGDAALRVLLTNGEAPPPFAAGVPAIVDLQEAGGTLGRERDGNLGVPVSPDQVAYVIYTSGSTGRPKGVAVPHGALTNHMAWMREAWDLDGRERVLLKTPASFDASVWEFFAPLTSGGCLVAAREGGHQDSAYLLETIRERAVTTLQVVPLMLDVLSADEDFSACVTLRRVCSGGDALRETVAARVTQCLDVSLQNLYGPTETCIDATAHTYAPGGTGPTVPIGRPIANTRVHVAGGDRQPVPIGVPGELSIGGRGVARGYVQQPALTAERFLPDGFSADPGQRVYRTGDLVQWCADGALEYLGRLDYQVKLRGHRIELGEIEAVLQAHDGVRDAVAAVRADRGGDGRLVAYVRWKRGAHGSIEALRRTAAARLPEPLVPSAWIVLDALPLGPNGKLDRQALPAPDDPARTPAAAFVEPQTPAEVTLARLWREVLLVERVGLHDNFFELGGDSIQALQVVGKARQAGIKIHPKDLFQHQTIAALAALAEVADAQPQVEARRAGVVPLTPVQHWFFEQAAAEPHHWNMPLFLEIPGAIDAGILEQVVRALVAHHDALHHRFRRGADGWEGFTGDPDAPVPFRTVDLSSVPEEEQAAAITAAGIALQSTLDLEHGPMIQAAHFHRGSGRSARLLIVIHHLVVDGVSWRVLMQDMQTAYVQRLSGKNIRLAPSTTTYARWAERLRQFAQSDALRDELAYWQGRPWSKARPLPVDNPHGSRAVSAEASCEVSLTVDETTAILQDVPKIHRTQINDVLLTALATAYERWSGQTSLLTWLEGHGREDLFPDLDLWRTVGWFTTLFPVLLETEGGASASASLPAIKEQLRAIPRGGIGFGLLRYLTADPEVTRLVTALPQPQLAFNYLGRLDGPPGERAAAFKPAGEDIGPAFSTAGRLPFLLEINALVLDGRLRVRVRYSRDQYREATVRSFAESFVDQLRAIVTGGSSAAVPGLTAAEFPHAGLSQSELDDLVGEIEEGE